MSARHREAEECGRDEADSHHHPVLGQGRVVSDAQERGERIPLVICRSGPNP
jgi:hypothetical protein